MVVPYNICDWPVGPREKVEASNPQLEPIQRIVSELPRTEHTPELEPGGTLKDGAPGVRDTLAIWKHNRKLYPGWLILPASKQQRMNSCTDGWTPHILRALTEMGALDQLSAIFECVWRKGLQLEPPSVELVEAAINVLKMVDCGNRTVEGATQPNADWGKLRAEWVGVAMALATDARHEFDRVEFDRWMGEVSTFVDDDADVKHFIAYEHCLWAASELNYGNLHGRLADWSARGSDPVWAMRKAALLFEAGLKEDAEGHVREALASIREHTADPCSLANPSREGWALWSALRWEEVLDSPASTFRRWEELSILKCNANLEKQSYTQAISRRSDTADSPPFDLGVIRGKGITFSSVGYYRYLTAHRGIRLTELAGLPPSQDGIAVASDILGDAAEELSQHEPELAIRLILRISRYDQDKRLNRILTRSLIASVPQEVVEKLSDSTINVIRFALPRMTAAGQRGDVVFWIEKCRVAMEALSRFVLRLPTTSVESVFLEALSWYENASIAKDPWFIQPIRHLLARCCEALPKPRMSSLFFDLMSAPMVGMNGFEAFSDGYVEPAYILPRGIVVPARNSETEAKWGKLVDQIIRGLRIGGQARKRASMRLWRIARDGALTEAEEEEVAKALWQDDRVAPNDLPRETDLMDWPFLQLPELSVGLAERTFRHKWLGWVDPAVNEGQEGESFSVEDGNSALWQIGMALQGLRASGRDLTLSEAERNGVASLVQRWGDWPLPAELRLLQRQELTFSEGALNLERASAGLKYILVEIDECSAFGEGLFNKARELQEHGVQTRGLAAGLAKSCTSQFNEVVQWMRTGIASNDKHTASNAIRGLSFWLRTSTQEDKAIPAPTVDIVREIGVIVATRREPALAAALECGKAILGYGTAEQKKEVSDLFVEGLIYLEKALSYDREDGADDVGRAAERDIPLLRWGCVELAHAMRREGFEKRGDHRLIGLNVEHRIHCRRFVTYRRLWR